ncbi:MAG: hypothetical protein AAFQ74_02050 [Cyanobacteria bacterium J06623_4]
MTAGPVYYPHAIYRVGVANSAVPWPDICYQRVGPPKKRSLRAATLGFDLSVLPVLD